MIEIDRIDNLINLKGLRIVHKVDDGSSGLLACQRLSRIGDEIVEQLVEWTKMLPFYHELPVEVHTHLLTQRWAELVGYAVNFQNLTHLQCALHSQHLELFDIRLCAFIFL